MIDFFRSKIEKNETSNNITPIFDKIIENTQNLLKIEWERVKKEIIEGKEIKI